MRRDRFPGNVSGFITTKDHAVKTPSVVSLLAAVVSIAAGGCSQSSEPGPALFSSRRAPHVQAMPDEGFRVEWVSNTMPGEVKAGSNPTVQVTFKNVGNAVWRDPGSTGNQPPQAGAVRLTYRWLPAAERPCAYGQHVDLGSPLAPGQSATLSVSVAVPSAPGAYRLQFDLVQELVVRFEAMDAPRLVIPVRVQ